ncbi:MAG: biopolymer transporter ExbD [Chitinophagaceae bacterium]|nr:biopolymer transporter ExbD [Chitinophagaceae bacterium]
MARPKIKRGSTFVDMTAMCDVAFLLLTFFILAAQFKPSEAITVVTPTSVSTKHAPQKDYFTVTLDKDNKIYVDMDPGFRASVIEKVGELTNIEFSPADVQAFVDAEFVGVPLNQLKKFDLLRPDEKAKVTLPGIPYDSTNNELYTWITAAVRAGEGKKINFLIKGDNDTKYTTFKKVLDAFKKNEIFKYNLMTESIAVPEGTDLYKKNVERMMNKGKGGNEEEES